MQFRYHIVAVYCFFKLYSSELVAVRRDNCWYRARVISSLRGDEEEGSSGLVVQLVDRGNLLEVAADDVWELQERFLHLPFQAIEASLSGVTPSGEEWSAEAKQMYRISRVFAYGYINLYNLRYDRFYGLVKENLFLATVTSTLPLLSLVLYNDEAVSMGKILVEEGLAEEVNKPVLIDENELIDAPIPG